MTTETLASIRRQALAVLAPPPRQRLSEWIERNVILPDGVSALPGPVRLWPFQHAIADAIGDPFIPRVTLIKPVRVGFTTLLTGALAGYVANDPAPILALLPTEADARDYVVSDIEPIFASSPGLGGLLAGEKDESGRNTLLHRRFPGGSLKVVAAKAPRNLRRHNVRVLLCDEVDGMETGPEGPPILLAERRTMSFPDRKIVIGSTPVFEETSEVLRAYARSDQRVFEVPCPSCGAFTEILWSMIEWPDDCPREAAFRCPHCRDLIDERLKHSMVMAGRWRATAPDVEGHAGFRLNALVSLLANASWGQLATEFLDVKDDSERLQTFVNTILGQGWKASGSEIDDGELASRREAFGFEAMPEEVLVLTMGLDVQRDRIEWTAVGWSRDGTAFVLGSGVVWGAPDDEATWADVDEVLKMRPTHPLGGRIAIDAAVIDSGDGETMELVYAFAFPRGSRKVMAGKGVSGTRPWIEPSKSKVRGGRLWLVGVDGIKASILSRLARGQSIRFSSDLEAAWFEQLASERVVVRYTRGQPSRRFERIPGRRAEALDCVVYAFAARQVVTVNWDTRTDALRQDIEEARPKVSVKIKSRFMR